MVFLAYPSPKMDWVLAQIKEKDGILPYQAPPTPSTSFAPPYTNSFQKQSSPPSTPSTSGSKISPTLLFIIVILAVVFFLSGLLHLLVRFLTKHPSSPSSQSNRYAENSNSDTIQRQLQQLFHLHDSGLDQAFIDALPIFLYKEIMGLKEPFDCAVCLCEFSEDDNLRLLPLCSHAFHLDCIDTWLLSNSTCPLCRGTLFSSGLAIENPVFDFDDLREADGISGDVEDGFSSSAQKIVEIEEAPVEKRVFPVRLGKFRSVNDGGEDEGGVTGEGSSSNLDARRCFSMGSYQYVVANSNLQVTLCQDRDGDGKHQHFRRRESNGVDSALEVDMEGKKLWSGSKRESFSVSKIWLWSKKGKFSGPADNTQTGIPPFNVSLPWIEKTQDM